MHTALGQLASQLSLSQGWLSADDFQDLGTPINIVHAKLCNSFMKIHQPSVVGKLEGLGGGRKRIRQRRDSASG